MKAYLLRLQEDLKQTLSEIIFYDNDVNRVLEIKALELPNRDNKNSISRINAGKYICKLRYSPKYKWHYHLQDVEGRTLILIHFGNYYTNTKGCIIVGNAFTDINNDGYRDVTSSKKTLKRILEKMPDEFELMVVDN
jgi:hypothetical protein